MLVGSLSPTADWNLLNDKFYCKQEVYSMTWRGVDLSKLTVVVAPFGGPIAAIRDDRKIMALRGQTTQPDLRIYTSAGNLITQLQWDKGRIIGLGWTNTEHLLCVLEGGLVRVYDIHGEFIQFSLGEDAKEHGVVECRLWDTGLVALTGDFKFVAITNLDEPRPQYLADPGITQAPYSWTVLSPQQTLSRHLEVFLAVNATVIVLDSATVQDQSLTQGPFLRMSVSPNGKFLALYTSEGKLWVVSTDFQKNLAEFSTNSANPPTQMTWCGTDSVVLHWPGTVLMVGPFGDWIKYTYDGVVHLVTEIDGLRIISNDKCEFLQRVPSATESIFKIGSTAPGAILFDAYEHFEKKSPRADENIRNIKFELAEAVDTCVEAAGHELNAPRQRALLKAASFGKCFLDSYNANHFLAMCKSIRVLNAVRNFEIGIPLTFVQYERITPSVLVDRLVMRHHHLLAFRICDYLTLSHDRVLIHWACTKIKVSVDDEDTLCRLIVEKLGGRESGISYTEVAKVAYDSGQRKLATKLLDYEPQAANQVPLLMGMEEDEVALIKAIESGDTDLVYLVMLHMKRKLSPAEFFRIIGDKPLACNLLELYCKQQDPQLLRDFYYQEDRRVDSANAAISEGYQTQDMLERVNKFKIAQKLYSVEKERAFEAKTTEDEVKLLLLQDSLQRDLGQEIVGLSVVETIAKLLELGEANKAAKVKSDFKVSDKRYV
ncbi:Vps16, N-terminal region-domain-containing protein [Fimicolochytrium jonesii]|uniref:Vps16, N-terminal region-domain-containing protein n=1 Tax=Fimicolochytrium jonesii TaxID=1396493 RepID=UPI0022FDFA8B|nr:Vps16, N-terminal region-domain-containing protein [Fimicolochytrium jonesii]KAI8822509.1 Vps16, N-terminal region-domain-containing protein [Fimicolochytrium jonesii]